MNPNDPLFPVALSQIVGKTAIRLLHIRLCLSFAGKRFNLPTSFSERHVTIAESPDVVPRSVLAALLPSCRCFLTLAAATQRSRPKNINKPTPTAVPTNGLAAKDENTSVNVNSIYMAPLSREIQSRSN